MARYTTVSVTPELYEELKKQAQNRAEDIGISELSQAKFIEFLLNFYKENR